MISLILAFISGVANAFMDLSSEDRFKNDYLDKSSGSKNKWKQPQEPGVRKWYHFFYTPLYKEKFPLSSSLLVKYTDFWHLMKSIFLITLISTAVCYSPTVIVENKILEGLINFVAIRSSMALGFIPTYNSFKRYLKNKKD